MTLLDQCKIWNENDEYQKIIEALEAVPAQERTPEMDSELARAYNNQAAPGDRELFRKAIALLKPHEAYFAGDHCWNFRMGYSYYYLDQEGRALPYFQAALEARPGDGDTQEFIEWCQKGVALPRFSECFRERTEAAWEKFAQQEAQLRQRMDEDKDHQRGDELVAQMEDVLHLAFDDISFEMGFNGQKHELILTPEGDKVKLFELVYFQKHAPKKVLEHWNILAGRQPNPGIGLRTDDGWEVSGEDVQVWLEERGKNSFALSAYCEKLLPLLREEEGRAWWMLTTLTDQVLGEISHMRYIDAFDVLEEPKGEQSILLSDLPDKLKGMGLDLAADPEDYLENYIGYEMEPNEDPEADWRLDVIAGSTNCAPLINGYLSAENDSMDDLHADGVVAGFFCYPLDTLREEEGSDKIFAFRDELEDYLSSACGPDVLILTGGATGIFCGYVDFIAWDLPAVLNKVQDFFADTDLPWADFHTFRREAGTVSLKKPEEDELEETLTGMDYIPYTLENADAFYRQLEQWNDEDEYTRCIQALNAIPEDWRDYRFAYALSRALENYAIIGDREEGTPGRKGDKALLRAIQVLEAVREEGRDKAEWNMRMAYAYQYLEGQEEKAIPYAQRWMELDPEDKNAPAVIRECEEELAKRSGGELENGAEERAPAGPVLTAEDVRELESMCEGVSGYFYKMLNFLEERLQDGVRRGRFTWERVRADLDTALWYSYICNNVDEYEYYYRAAQWMPDSEQAAEQARSGVWYYRYACALTYCGRLEEALKYAEKGVGLDPEYVWGWLMYGRLLSHFGDREGALAAADRGLALEPGDYEFTTLRREIQKGRTLEEMEFHWIDPESDRKLQAGLDESAGDKKRAISCILCRREALEEIKAALAPVEWEADAPYCTFTMPYQGSTVEGRFFGNEAALSKVPAEWVRELVRRLPELDRRGLTFLSARAGLGTGGLALDGEPLQGPAPSPRAGLGTGGLALERFTIQMDRRLCLFYQRGEEQQMVRFAPDFALCEEDQPALAQPEGGTFLAFVLLEQPEWDAEEFKRTLRDDWGIPCMTEEKDSGEGGSTLVFEAEGFLTAVSLYPFPVPKGEAEQNAGRNYLWSEAEETTRRHRGQILVSTMARDGDVGQAARLQVKLVCAACGQDGVLGIYANGTVYQPEFYLEAAQMMEDGSLPLLNLVWPGLYRREGGLCAYTEGLRAFGKDELEVLDTRAEPGDLRGFVLDIASYVLEQDVTLRDGETIGFSEGQKLPITRSAGIWHDGMTLKIGYPSKEEGEDENSGET